MPLLQDPRVQVLSALFAATLVFLYVVRRAINHFARQAHRTAPPEHRGVFVGLVHATVGPLSLLVWYYGLFAMARVAIAGGWLPPDWRWTAGLVHRANGVGLTIAGLWFFYRSMRVIDAHFAAKAAQTPGRFDNVVMPLLGLSLRVIVPILALFLFVRLWPITGTGLDAVNKLLAVALIGAVTWVLRGAIALIEAEVIRQDSDPNDYAARALVTRVSVLRKIALVVITLFALASTLMLFPEVRHIGQSILASAGIAGIILGFAAQKTLGNLLAGLQLAFTQPVRIGDLILVENELGNVEEITLTYVVVRIWDLRRLVLPISYLIEKPIQNWTRTSMNLLSPVVLRVDFDLPVAEFRQHMKTVVENSPHWDKQAFAVQVTDADAGSMAVRILGSARGPGESFNLQCEIREQAFAYLTEHHPESLPNFRPDRPKTS